MYLTSLLVLCYSILWGKKERENDKYKYGREEKAGGGGASKDVASAQRYYDTRAYNYPQTV